MAEDKDVKELDLIQEVHDRFDALIEIMEEKGLVEREEFDKKYVEIIQRKANQ